MYIYYPSESCSRDAKHTVAQSWEEWLLICFISYEVSLCGMAGTSSVACASPAPLLCIEFREKLQHSPLRSCPAQNVHCLCIVIRGFSNVQLNENLHTCRYLVVVHDGICFRLGVFVRELHIFPAAVCTGIAKISKKRS